MINKQIKNHETSIELLEAMQHFENLIKHKETAIKMCENSFPRLQYKYIHNIDIYNKCINRLQNRYNKLNKL
jgi:hypothetical protein